MALSVFDDKTKLPHQYELTEALGPAANLWEEIEHMLVSRFDQLTEEWVFSGKNYGWALRLKCKKRTILYLTPKKESCIAGFALGEKAVKTVIESTLPESVKQEIQNVKQYAEGRAFRMEINSMEDVKTVILLAQIKMEH